MFEVQTLAIDGVLHLRPKVFPDKRGSFFEFTKKSDEIKLPDFVQDNVSYSKKNVLRGLHFQKPPFAQGKLVLILEGQILDIAVDIRPESPTIGQFVSLVLDSRENDIIYIPEGFAHGFYVLSESAIIYYKNTNEYSPEHTSGIIWNDKNLGINWPTDLPLLSDEDKKHISFKEYLLEA
tara:strand:+ start:173 stop:709 length:537 start_codon:yes stop_codon:yes gene_type:complete